jgi:L-sorbose 1-phosphate reductase
MAASLPETQYAVQLVGPDALRLNTSKPVPTPGPHEILVKVEAVGLCFSDLKLLKQFDKHARKTEIIGGIEPEVLQGIQSYQPGGLPTVPGHELVCRIVAVGDQVKQHQVGQRCLVQTDYRQLPTAGGSNAAFGYNFEGGLQEYTLLDERVVIAPDGDRFLIPVGEDKSASAVALVEPWACVEASYVTRERNTVKAGGRLLVVVAEGRQAKGVNECFSPDGEPAEVQTLCPAPSPTWPTKASTTSSISAPTRRPSTCSMTNCRRRNHQHRARRSEHRPGGVGRRRARALRHDALGRDRRATMRPSRTGTSRHRRIRANDRVLVVGAAGPMGQMHVIRNVCLTLSGLSVVGTDLDIPRIDSLRLKAEPMARKNHVALRLVNPQQEPLDGTFTYFALMAPVGALVADAIQRAGEGAIINIFAGIPAPVRQDLDLDAYIAKRGFLLGTSGSTIEDMRIVLRKVEGGQLDTNASVDAISGMAGATDGIAAVENRTLAGKIIVYPMLHDVGLIPLTELHTRFPTVAEKLDHGKWTRAAEQELLRVAGGNG